MMDPKELWYLDQLAADAANALTLKARSRSRWARCHLGLLLGAAILAAAAGVGGLTELLGKEVTASIALLSAIVSAANVAVGDRAKNAANGAAEAEGRWGEIRADARNVRAQADLLPDNAESREWLLAEYRRLGKLAKEAAKDNPEILTAPPQEATELTPPARPAEPIDRALDEVRGALLELGAVEQPLSAPIAGPVELAALFVWKGELLGLASLTSSRPHEGEHTVAEYADEMVRDIATLAQHIPDGGWLVLAFDHELRVPEERGIVQWQTQDPARPETLPRVRAVRTDIGDLTDQLRSALN
jgi:hypothetical protein